MNSRRSNPTSSGFNPWLRRSTTCPATSPFVPMAFASSITAWIILSGAINPLDMTVICSNAKERSASPAKTAIASPNTLFSKRNGLPLRRSALSMHGRSSWIRELVWIISTAQAADMAIASSPPTSSHAAMQSRDLTRFPPASSEYRTASWIVRGFKSGKETSRAAFTDSALPIIYDLKSKVEL
ncbi:hypothetical protein IGI04_011891 [Brassica rapa subsp. trilocularis]|uniref:Uncharacterized protein n=1 Tax=Brassica rapa subsp. trilocularis TaxID=1813537 RepID=A0ABQ7N4F9_BRACM|nr:hypothetical protein IGI04_011891 [Brassica rapa subsp. trilocularis]